MSLTDFSLRSTVAWTLSADNTDSTPTTNSDTVTAGYPVDTSAYQQVLLGRYTLAAGGNTTVDFHSFTNRLGEAVIAGKAVGFLLRAVGSAVGAKVQWEPGASNPLAWFLSGTTPALTLECGANGCHLCLMDGVWETIDATHRNVKLSNPGSQPATVYLYALLGS